VDVALARWWWGAAAVGYPVRVAAKKRASAKPTTATGKAAKPKAGKTPAAAAATFRELFLRLQKAIPEPRCELDHRNAWQLLVATILSAQSTDRTVNRVTPELFRRWPTPAALAAADRAEVEQVVHRTGFFRNKSKAIQLCSLAIEGQHGGDVPRTIEAMLALHGVARKTANVVLGTAYRIPSGIVVDTHVMRVAQRLGLSQAQTPEKIEQELCALLPQGEWIDGGHRLLLHGRYVCLAQGPKCTQCPLHELCPSRAGAAAGKWTERAAWEQALVGSRGGVQEHGGSAS